MKKRMSLPKKILLFSVFLSTLFMLYPSLRNLINELTEEPIEYEIVSVTKYVTPNITPKPTLNIPIDNIEYEYRLGEFEAIEGEVIAKGVDLSPFISCNPKTVGAISIPGTNIYYPFVSSVSDDEWIRTNFLGDFSYFGTIFLDYNNNSNLSNDINILYGHNMLDGNMFAYLNRYIKNNKYLNEDNVLYLSTKDKIEIYTAFCVNQIENTNGDYRLTNFNSVEEYNEFISKVTSESKFLSYIPNSKDKILQLTTCSSDNDYRTVLFFSKIAEIPNILTTTGSEEYTNQIKNTTNEDKDYRRLFSNVVAYKIPSNINFLNITDNLGNEYTWSLEEIPKDKQDSLGIKGNYFYGLGTFQLNNITFSVCNINGQLHLISKEKDLNLVFGTTLKEVIKEADKVKKLSKIDIN